MDAGVVMVGGMSGSPLSFSELEAWARLRGLELSHFEAQCLRGMSAAYLEMLNAVSDGPVEPPYLPEGSTYYADLNKKLRSGLDAMVTRK